MRLEAKREAEVAKRKGLAFRTIVAIIWLGICFILAYLFVGWLKENEYLQVGFFYNSLFIPRTISEDLVWLGFTFVLVIIMQFFLLLGYAFFSPEGRLRTGTPSVKARNPDPLDKKYDYR